MTTNARKTRRTRQTVNTNVLPAAPPLGLPPTAAQVVLPANVLAELKAGTELLTELLAKAVAATSHQVTKAAVDDAWAAKLAETPTPPGAPQAMRVARGSTPPPVMAAQQAGGRKADLSDPRLAGLTEISRVFAGWNIKVKVQPDGFEWGGKTWPSLSAIARAVTGTRRNGFEFFNLTERGKQHHS